MSCNRAGPPVARAGHAVERSEPRLDVREELPRVLLRPWPRVELAEVGQFALEQEALSLQRRGQVDERPGAVGQRPVQARRAGGLDQVFEDLVHLAGNRHADECLDQGWSLADVPRHRVADTQPVHRLVEPAIEDRHAGAQDDQPPQRSHVLHLGKQQFDPLAPQVVLPVTRLPQGAELGLVQGVLVEVELRLRLVAGDVLERAGGPFVDGVLGRIRRGCFPWAGTSPDSRVSPGSCRSRGGRTRRRCRARARGAPARSDTSAPAPVRRPAGSGSRSAVSAAAAAPGRRPGTRPPPGQDQERDVS